MKRETSSIAVGALLVLGGLFFLAANFGLFQNAGQIFAAFAFGVGGAIFLAVFATNTEHNWWAVFPAFALLGIGSLIGLSALFPRLSDTVGGGLFLGALSLSFWIVYLMRPERWWAVIPGGTLLTLAVVALLGSSTLPLLEQVSGAVFFFGLAMTFGVVYYLPTPQGRMTWAVFPATACAVLGLLVMVSAVHFFTYVWPLALIAGGLYLLYRHGLRRAQ